jgi:hypothetical protein
LEALAVDSGDQAELCERYGIHRIQHRNRPLGEKWNAGLAEVLKYQWDYLLILGSDDLLSSEYLSQDFGELTGLTRCGLIDTETGRRAIFENDYVMGVGRVIRRDVVEALADQVVVQSRQTLMVDGGSIRPKKPVQLSRRMAMRLRGYADIIEERPGPPRLWADHLNQGLDFSSDMILMRNGFTQKKYLSDKILAVDLKSKENIWKFDNYPLQEWTVDWMSKSEEDAIRRLAKAGNTTKLH